MTNQPDPPTIGAVTEVVLRRNVMLPDGSTYGIEADFSINGDPVSGDLLHCLAQMVESFDRATARGIAEGHGDAAGMAFLDRVAEATSRWTEDQP